VWIDQDGAGDERVCGGGAIIVRGFKSADVWSMWRRSRIVSDVILSRRGNHNQSKNEYKAASFDAALGVFILLSRADLSEQFQNALRR
jgi:hypothetical protein